MSIISKEIAKQHLEMWLKAEEAVSTGQSYQIEQMQLTRASLKQIRESISFWFSMDTDSPARSSSRLNLA